MLRLLRNPKAVIALVILSVLGLLALVGGPIGAAFGLGFLGSSLAHIQIAPESALPSPFLGFTITNTMVTTWIVIIALVVIAYLGTRRMYEVPGRLQGALEAILQYFIG